MQHISADGISNNEVFESGYIKCNTFRRMEFRTINFDDNMFGDTFGIRDINFWEKILASL